MMPLELHGWRVDAEGYLLTPTGAKAARIAPDGALMLYDKRAKCERPLTFDQWQQLVAEAIQHKQ
jgi:hypothetical protein